ncbi:hypothetical protein [Asticcacaulis sp. YBE204]|uniref:hypothetical protein n=1 Tax=Asticcacaulis sp. YBE204 TaxID=1282363 RepID=UPI0003C3CDC1|nr:hypothetical protein [Asticcacaulis sp. YBE204]ESQ77383.1 hypothetical protein AEYBE204_17815 [Asticcacaulis sp. YBE204]
MRYSGDDYNTPPDGFYDPTLWDTLVRLWWSGGLIWIAGIVFCVLMILAGTLAGSKSGPDAFYDLKSGVKALWLAVTRSVSGSQAQVVENARTVIAENDRLFANTNALMNLVAKHHDALTKAATAIKEVDADKAKTPAAVAAGMSGGTVINIAVNQGGGVTADPDGRTPVQNIGAMGGDVNYPGKPEEKKKPAPGFDKATKVWLLLQKLSAQWRDLTLMTAQYAAVQKQLNDSPVYRTPENLTGTAGADSAQGYIR